MPTAYAALVKARDQKYNNRPVVIDGYRFPSKFEGSRFLLLKTKLDSGLIHTLKVHPRYLLHAKFVDSFGQSHKPIFYEADFEYHDKSLKKTIIEDCKGFETEVFRIKRKLFLKNLSTEFLFVLPRLNSFRALDGVVKKK